MIVIVESGATKSDWRVLTDDGCQIARFLHPGTNVSSMSLVKVKEILAEGLASVSEFNADSFFLYTAGVVTDEIKSELKDFILSKIAFSELEIHNDLLGAARGALGRQKGVAAIMGTGSNTCFYDGVNFTQKVASGGFILGDDGSASALGRLFISDYIKNLIPAEVSSELEAQFDVSYQTIVENVYRGIAPARYLGGFAPFIVSHYDNPYIKEMVDRNFQNFIDRSLKMYDTKSYPVGVVGGFGYACREIFQRLCEASGINVLGFNSEPIEGLIRYHCNLL